MNVVAPWFEMSGEKIYTNFHSAPGPEGVFGSARELQSLVEAQNQDIDKIHALAVKLESSWQGRASGAARRGLVPFSADHQTSAEALTTTAKLLNDQAEAFVTAKNSVTKVPPNPGGASFMDSVKSISPWQTSHEKKVAAYNEATRHNTEVMSAYEAATTRNAAALPRTYGRMVHGASDEAKRLAVHVSPASGVRPGVRHAVPHPKHQTAPATTHSAPSSTAAPSPVPVVPPAAGTGPLPDAPSGAGTGTTTTAGAAGAPAAGAPAGGAVSGPSPVGTGGAPGMREPATGWGVPGRWQPTPGEPGAPGGGRGAQGGTQVRGGTGPIGERGGRPGAGLPAAGRTGPAADEALARRGPGATSGGAPAGAGGRRRGADDDEHEDRFTLHDEHPFGSPQPTAPPVIGERDHGRE